MIKMELECSHSAGKIELLQSYMSWNQFLFTSEKEGFSQAYLQECALGKWQW